MIGLGTRFADYGLTGGFFMLVQLSALAWFSPKIATTTFTSICKFVSARFAALPEPAHLAFSSLLVALAIVTIFFAGLLLDLIGSLFATSEGSIFKEHLDKNEGWFSHFVEETETYSRGDYERINSFFIHRGESWRRLFAYIRFWRLDAWRIAFDEQVRVWRGLSALGSFRRLESLLIAYVLAASGGSKLNWLGDQFRLCRISRSISASLFILAFVVSSYTPFLEYTAMWVRLIPLIISYAATGLSLFITFRAYSRFCTTLFSLTYAYHHMSYEGDATA